MCVLKKEKKRTFSLSPSHLFGQVLTPFALTLSSLFSLSSSFSSLLLFSLSFSFSSLPSQGTLVLLHGGLVHMSHPNKSAKPRHAYTLHMVEGSQVVRLSLSSHSSISFFIACLSFSELIYLFSHYSLFPLSSLSFLSSLFSFCLSSLSLLQ